MLVSLVTPRPVKELEAIHWQPPLQAILHDKFAGATDPRLVGIMRGSHGRVVLLLPIETAALACSGDREQVLV